MYFETIAGDNELVHYNQINSNNKFNYEELNEYSFQSKIIDPTFDIYQLFNQFNLQFFSEKLSSVFVEWNQQMTNDAGICIYETEGNCCRITLNEPLLKLRPKEDLVQTLLHEMIHAYLFVTKNHKDRNEHGSEFLKHMIRINQAIGTNITIYHRFSDDVDHSRQYSWSCTGPCQNWKPFYGYVKRSINRSPSKNDRCFDEHGRRGNGQFIKVKEAFCRNKSKSEIHSLSEPPIKKVKALSVDQPVLNKLLVTPTNYVECQFCHEAIYKDNLRLHLDMKCPMYVQ